MKSPKLSVMIPTYNSANYLKDAVNSVLAQNYTDYELIIVDNASTDNTEEIVQEFQDQRIKYYKNKINLGSRGNINRCMELATGEYLRHLCADDILLPGVLGKQVHILDTLPKVGVVTCDMYVTDERLENRRRANFFPGHEKGSMVIKACCQNFGNWIGGPSNVMMRRDAVKETRYNKNLKWVSDLDFFCRLLEEWDYYNIDEPGYLYRRHSASDTVALSQPGVQKREELHFCLQRVGFKLAHLRFMRERIGFAGRLKLLRELIRSGKSLQLLKTLHNLVVGKNFKAILLSDYWDASISNNIAYSNKNGIIVIGKGTSVNEFTVIRIENGPNADSETSCLVIGDNTYIGEHNNIRAAGGFIKIGDNVLISQMVTIVASNHGTEVGSTIMSQPWIRNKVIIENDVWIGAGSVILPGAHICTGSVIAANSVVKGFVGPNSIMAGAPAKKIKERC